MKISLTLEDQKLVNKLVDSGQYNSLSEIFCDSLELLRERDQVRSMQTEELLKEPKLGVRQLKTGRRISSAKETRLEYIAAEIKSRDSKKSELGF
jgi:Arc/MetJ-type ribon-helix-helix transcriptional regulator